MKFVFSDFKKILVLSFFMQAIVYGSCESGSFFLKMIHQVEIDAVACDFTIPNDDDTTYEVSSYLYNLLGWVSGISYVENILTIAQYIMDESNPFGHFVTFKNAILSYGSIQQRYDMLYYYDDKYLSNNHIHAYQYAQNAIQSCGSSVVLNQEAPAVPTSCNIAQYFKNLLAHNNFANSEELGAVYGNQPYEVLIAILVQLHLPIAALMLRDYAYSSCFPAVPSSVPGIATGPAGCQFLAYANSILQPLNVSIPLGANSQQAYLLLLQYNQAAAQAYINYCGVCHNTIVSSYPKSYGSCSNLYQYAQAIASFLGVQIQSDWSLQRIYNTFKYTELSLGIQVGAGTGAFQILPSQVFYNACVMCNQSLMYYMPQVPQQCQMGAFYTTPLGMYMGLQSQELQNLTSLSTNGAWFMMYGFAQRQNIFGANVNMSAEVPDSFVNYCKQCGFSLNTTPVDSKNYTCDQLQSYKSDLAGLLGFEGIAATQLINQSSNQDFYNQLKTVEYAQDLAEDFGAKIATCKLPITFTTQVQPTYAKDNLSGIIPVPPLVCGQNNLYLQVLATYLNLTNVQLQQLQSGTSLQAYNLLKSLPNGQDAATNFAGYCHYCNQPIIGTVNQVPAAPNQAGQYQQYAQVLFEAMQSTLPTITVNGASLNTQQIFVILDQMEDLKKITGYSEAWANYVSNSGATIITKFPSAPADCAIGNYGSQIVQFLGVALPASIYYSSNHTMYTYIYNLESQMNINHAASNAFAQYCTSCNQPAN